MEQIAQEAKRLCNLPLRRCIFKDGGASQDAALFDRDFAASPFTLNTARRPNGEQLFNLYMWSNFSMNFGVADGYFAFRNAAFADYQGATGYFALDRSVDHDGLLRMEGARNGRSRANKDAVACFCSRIGHAMPLFSVRLLVTQ
jgi:hypothetical protein